MGQILLVRHGQASWGAEDYDVLSDLGHRQAALLGEAYAARGLSADRVVIGSMRRHRETAEECLAAAGWDAPVTVDPEWDEFDHMGMLASHEPPHDAELTRSEFQRWFEAATDRWTGGAHDEDYDETFAAFTARVDRALGRLAGTSGTTVVFSSGGPIAWAAAVLLAGPGGATGPWRRLNPVCVNSGVTKLVTGGRGTTLVSFNDHAHLEGIEGALSYR
ncbi:MAG: histidine phosphatase family protein [Marmoricola sp.]